MIDRTGPLASHPGLAMCSLTGQSLVRPPAELGATGMDLNLRPTSLIRDDTAPAAHDALGLCF